MEKVQGKHLLFVSGDFCYPSFQPILQGYLKTLRSHGVVVYAVFQQGKSEETQYHKDMKKNDCFDHEFYADVGAADGAEKIADKVKELEFHLDAVWSMHEATQPIVAQVQELLGLPGNPVSAYEIARDKYRARKVLEQHDMNSIKAYQIWNMEDGLKAQEHVGFPMVVKPTVGQGSYGVYRVMNKEELSTTLERIFDDIKSNWCLDRNAIGTQAPIIAETLVVPQTFGPNEELRMNEHDVEVLLWDGKPVYSNIIDNIATRPPYFQEIGSCAPTLMSAQQEQEMKEYAVKCLQVMGFTRGGFHVECWMTENGPLLIEVNARVGGGATIDTHKAVWGIDPMMEFALTMLDVPINPAASPSPLATYGYLLPNAEVTGVFKQDALTFLDHAKSSPSHIAHKYFKKSGDSVKGNDKHIADWIGEIRLQNRGDQVNETLLEMDHLLKHTAKLSMMETELEQMPQDVETTLFNAK